MIQIEDTVISKMMMHRISNVANKSIFSESIFESSDAEEDAVLKKLFLKPFQTHVSTFEFTHNIDLSYNVLYGQAQAIFEDEDFVTHASNIATHLQEQSSHPNINDGDVYIVKFEDIQLGAKHYQGIGIYKYEDKENFIETRLQQKQIDLQFRKGLASKKPDKACLIIGTEAPYTLLIIDSHSQETDYWQKDFIQHKAKNDNINNTTDFLTLAKNFITEQIPNEYEVNKTDQLNLLNRSVEYFKGHDTFDKAEFEEEVFGDKSIIQSFRNFDETWREAHQIEMADQFEISAQAVKKQARVFKSVLKLDKNFHIYIHGDRELIEQGVDKDGRKFYKIYYEEEK